MSNTLLRRTLHKNNANARFNADDQLKRKRELVQKKQKEDRNQFFLQRRNVVIEPSPPQPVVKDKRREKLLEWKAQKEASLRLQKAQKKPPFKLGAPSNILGAITNFPVVAQKLAVPSTVKKTATQTRSNTVKKPTAASQALASLADPPVSFAGGTKRVTRLQAKLVQEAQPSNRKPQPAMLKQEKEQGRKPPKSTKPVIPASFAPANHSFKPPINLTFPVTPDLMKRNKRTPGSKKISDWPEISGVKPLMANDSILNWVTDTGADDQSKGVPIKPTDVVKDEKVKKHPTTNRGSTKKDAERKPKLEEPVSQRSPQKRRSVRLATSKSTETVKASEANQTAAGDEQATSVENEVTEENKENLGDEENGIVAAKISRLSIHSPTRKDVMTASPQNIEGVVPAQFSPFIVTGRGADRHRSRRSRGNVSIIEDTEESKRAAQVKQFRLVLQTETNRLLELSDRWDDQKNRDAGKLPSEAEDLILGTVGQARLLTKDKFQQFKRLIDKFESGASQEKMTADDLTGFWEMVQLTVSGLDDRFKKLEDWKNKDWQEEVKVVPEEPVCAPRRVKVSAAIRKQANNRLKEIIAAARKNRQERKDKSSDESQKTFDGGFFKVESPTRKTEYRTPVKTDLNVSSGTTPNLGRKSLLQQVLTNSANKIAKSPSVTGVGAAIKASLLGRRVSMSSPDEPQILKPIPPPSATPAKSILKSAKSDRRQTVMICHTNVEDEKEATSSKPPRRSLRFNVGTRFNDSTN